MIFSGEACLQIGVGDRVANRHCYKQRAVFLCGGAVLPGKAGLPLGVGLFAKTVSERNGASEPIAGGVGCAQENGTAECLDRPGSCADAR